MEQYSEGYLGRAYIDALAQFGRALELPASRGWLLAREIPGHPRAEDACGAYPLFCCRDWSRLAEDMQALEGRLVSCVLVTDPFGDYGQDDLEAAFPDLVKPFKEHFTIELNHPLENIVKARHRSYARQALREYRVALCEKPLQLLQRWRQLYSLLIQRHDIHGMARFSDEGFLRQFQIPGVRVFYAERNGVIEGMQVWFRHNDVAYYHLGAYSDTGYRSRVSYALMWSSLLWFYAAGTTRVDLGGGAGLGQKEDGLTRFKRGWSNSNKNVYLCGRILNEALYNHLVDGAELSGQTYFPLYRAMRTPVAV
ncbi:MAG: GNAT family N-acetyltransferase [Thiogranum sp.]|nr:GNAT family N-acetyltransferase [Thiogranum sp.]